MERECERIKREGDRGNFGTNKYINLQRIICIELMLSLL